MKKQLILIAAGILAGGLAFADAGDGAIGIGIVTQSNNDSIVSKNLRAELFLDMGTQIAGPLHAGFELQGDVQKLDQTSFDITQDDISVIGFDNGDYAVFHQLQTLNETYTLWDLNLSPRAYLSFDIVDKAQLLAFVGADYNWQSLDYKVTGGTANGAIGDSGKTFDSNGNYEETTNSSGSWSAVAGLRLTLWMFYIDYTRWLQSDTTGNYSWDQYNLNRFAAGINLRF